MKGLAQVLYSTATFLLALATGLLAGVGYALLVAGCLILAAAVAVAITKD